MKNTHIIFRPKLIKAMIGKSRSFLAKIRKKLDDLNFFPVADKDTGKNILTLFNQTAKAISEEDYKNLDELIEDLLNAAQDSARGNIGIAVSNLLIGFFSVLSEQGETSQELAPEIWEWIEKTFSANEKKGIRIMDAKTLAKALVVGSEKAYNGFSKPENKTVLDVMKVAGEEAFKTAKLGEENPVYVLRKAILEAKKELEKTKGKIHKGGLISTEDAGAAAYIPILEAFLEVFMENQPELKGGKK